MRDALRRASEVVGIKVQAKSESVVRGTADYVETRLASAVATDTKGQVTAAEVANTYWERVVRESGASHWESVDVATLVRYPRAEAQKERERRLTDAVMHLKAANECLVRGSALEKGKKWMAAVREFRAGLAESAAVTDSTIHADGLPPLNEIKLALDAGLNRSLSQSRTAVFAVKGAGLASRTAGTVFTPNFLAGLGAGGYPLGEAGADSSALSITVEIEAAESSSVLGQMCVRASGSVRVAERASGMMILHVPIANKGFGKNREAAVQNAIAEAGKGAAAAVAPALIKREQ
ncbi:MAG: hypothetical protein HY897_18805 [Deltaproteobacteria bacterium]|nr:hypothetical protein [Deltaproteobacteria bacterium]